jgi:class 3 adenylate cyclase
MIDDWKISIRDDRKVIQLLIRELYGDDPGASVREVLQNAHDAVLARHNAPIDAGVSIRIDRDQGGQPIISVDDDGIGMTEEDLRFNLLAVGESGKSRWEDLGDAGSLRDIVSMSRDQIGKYGIGFLASFIIADRVQVITRHHKAEPGEALQLDVTFGTLAPPVLVHRDRPGTEVRLLVRDKADENTSFGEKLDELCQPASLKEFVKRLLYFSKVPIRFGAGGTGELLSTAVPDLQQMDARELFRELAPHIGGRPLRAARYSFSPEAGETSTLAFLYLWQGVALARRAGPVQLWVRSMFVEEGAQDLLPNWASCFSVLLVCPDLPLELDRRTAKRTSVEFHQLRGWLLHRCCSMLKEAINADFVDFTRETWPSIRGTVLPSALASLTGSFARNPFEYDAASMFMRDVGPDLPIPVLKYNPRAQGYFRTWEALSVIAKEADSTGAPPLPTLYYLRTSTGLETGVDAERVKNICIDARPSRLQGEIEGADIGNLTLAFIEALKTMLSDRFRFEELQPETGAEISPEERNQGWGELATLISSSVMVRGRSNRLEKYTVMVRHFRPTYLPAVAIEVTADESTQKQFLEGLTGFARNFPDFEQHLKDVMERLKTGERFRTLLLNADNLVMQRLAAAFANGSPATRRKDFLLLVANIAHNAGIDFQIGRQLGTEALSTIYTQFRQEMLVNFLSHIEDLENSVNLSHIPVLPEQRHAAVLFFDIRSSTHALLPLDKVEWGSLLSSLAEFAAGYWRKFSDHGAFFEKFTGDGFCVFWFAESDGDAAQQLKARVPSFMVEFRKWATSEDIRGILDSIGHGSALRARVAMTCGPVQFGRFGSTGSAVGLCAVRAARMLDSSNEYWAKNPDRSVVYDEIFARAAQIPPRRSTTRSSIFRTTSASATSIRLGGSTWSRMGSRACRSATTWKARASPVGVVWPR